MRAARVTVVVPSVCVCVFVCVCVCLYVCMLRYLNIYMYGVCMYVCVSVRSFLSPRASRP